MSDEGYFHLIIPTRTILEEFNPSENILALADTTPRDVVEHFLNGWLEHRSLQNTPGFLDMQINARGLHSLGARLYATDLIFEAMERRHEQAMLSTPNTLPPISEADRRDLERVLMEIWALLSEELFPLFEELQLTEHQIDRLQFARWTGDDVIVSLPRCRRTARREE